MQILVSIADQALEYVLSGCEWPKCPVKIPSLPHQLLGCLFFVSLTVLFCSECTYLAPSGVPRPRYANILHNQIRLPDQAEYVSKRIQAKQDPAILSREIHQI